MRVHLQLEPAQPLPCVMSSIMRTYAPFSAEPVHVAPQPALHSSSLSPASHFLARHHWLLARPSCSAQAPWLAVDHGSSGLSREKLCSAPSLVPCPCPCVCVCVRVCWCWVSTNSSQSNEPWFSMAASSIVPPWCAPSPDMQHARHLQFHHSGPFCPPAQLSSLPLSLMSAMLFPLLPASHHAVVN